MTFFLFFLFSFTNNIFLFRTISALDVSHPKLEFLFRYICPDFWGEELEKYCVDGSGGKVRTVLEDIVSGELCKENGTSDFLMLKDSFYTLLNTADVEDLFPAIFNGIF